MSVPPFGPGVGVCSHDLFEGLVTSAELRLVCVAAAAAEPVAEASALERRPRPGKLQCARLFCCSSCQRCWAGRFSALFSCRATFWARRTRINPNSRLLSAFAFTAVYIVLTGHVILVLVALARLLRSPPQTIADLFPAAIVGAAYPQGSQLGRPG